MEETGVTTVHKSPKIVVPKGIKQIGGMTFGEQGSLATICTAVNAAGTAISPIILFPSVKYKDHFVCYGSSGCTAIALFIKIDDRREFC